MSKKAAASAVEPDQAPETPSAEQSAGKVKVRSVTGGEFINPFTQEAIGGADVEVTDDNWLQSQIAAGKIETV